MTERAGIPEDHILIENGLAVVKLVNVGKDIVIGKTHPADDFHSIVYFTGMIAEDPEIPPGQRANP